MIIVNSLHYYTTEKALRYHFICMYMKKLIYNIKYLAFLFEMKSLGSGVKMTLEAPIMTTALVRNLPL